MARTLSVVQGELWNVCYAPRDRLVKVILEVRSYHRMKNPARWEQVVESAVLRGEIGGVLDCPFSDHRLVHRICGYRFFGVDRCHSETH